MNNKQDGSLTIEAVFVLTSFLFAMMFLFNIAVIYQIQNDVVHGLSQTGKYLAFSSYEYGEGDSAIADTMDFVTEISGFLGNSGGSAQRHWKWGQNYGEAAKDMFEFFCEGDLLEKNPKYGLMEGINSMDFSQTTKDDENLYIRVTYTVHLPFAFLGIDKIEMHSQMVCGLWEKG